MLFSKLLSVLAYSNGQQIEAHQFDIAFGSGEKVTQDCIDCHMPVQPSSLITFQLAGKTQKTPYLLRSHRIAIYPDETQKILSYIKSK